MRRWLLCLLLLAGAGQAHELRLESAHAGATVVRLTYADGQPFAFEAYELYPAGAATPAQVGRTDARGRVVFLAETAGEYRLKAWSDDGHGVDQRLAVQIGEAPVATAAPERSGLLLAGLSGIFGLFGLWQLYLRKK